MVQLSHDTSTPDIETASAEYADRFRGPVGEWFLSVQEKGVRELFRRHRAQPLSVLEIGGGHGQLAGVLRSVARDVTVHGSAPVCFERLGGLDGPGTGGLRFAVANLWELPFPDRAFDLVAGVRLLAHVKKWQELLDEMARVGRRYVLIDFPPLSSANLLTPALFWAKRGIEGNTRPYFCYWERTVRSHLMRTGFDRVSTYRQLALPMGAHRAAGRVHLSRGAEKAFRSLGITRLVGSPALLLAERGGVVNIHREAESR